MKFNFSPNPAVLGRSQKGQDSLIAHVFNTIGSTNRYCVEFGAVDGVVSSNTWYFRHCLGWDCLLLDCSYENPAINLYKRQITEENIVPIFDAFGVPYELDFLCIDIDGNDYWILNKILNGDYKPRVILVETCIRFDHDQTYIQKYNPDFRWNGSDWYGASPRAFKTLADFHGYTMVHIHLDDAILVRNDCLTPEMIQTAKEQFSTFAKKNSELYLSHGNATIDSNQWITTKDEY